MPTYHAISQGHEFCTPTSRSLGPDAYVCFGDWGLCQLRDIVSSLLLSQEHSQKDTLDSCDMHGVWLWFLAQKVGQTHIFKNPMSVTLAPLGKISCSLWRPRWPPNIISVVLQLASNNPADMIFGSRISFVGWSFYCCYFGACGSEKYYRVSF